MKDVKQKLLEEFDELDAICSVCKSGIRSFLSNAIDQTREETIKNEIKYWKGVFDKRPKDRDLESDSIAQNFARIEIERLESKIKSLINKQYL